MTAFILPLGDADATDPERVGPKAANLAALAHAGLRRRGRLDHSGRDESRHLEPLQRIIDCGRAPAEEMLEKFRGPWRGSVEPAYEEYAF